VHSVAQPWCSCTPALSSVVSASSVLATPPACPSSPDLGAAAMCPRAFNPSSSSAHDYTVVFSAGQVQPSAPDQLEGSFGLFFAGQTASLRFPANQANASAAVCELAFESLPNVRDVSCFVEANRSDSFGNTTYVVRVNAWASAFDSYMTNLWSHDGNPPTALWACDA